MYGGPICPALILVLINPNTLAITHTRTNYLLCKTAAQIARANEATNSCVAIIHKRSNCLICLPAAQMPRAQCTQGTATNLHDITADQFQHLVRGPFKFVPFSTSTSISAPSLNNSFLCNGRVVYPAPLHPPYPAPTASP